MSDLLVVDSLNKVYGSRTIFDSISFRVEKGASVAITGPSGSGKSTILNIAGLLEKQTSGSIKFKGKELPGINSSSATMLRRNEINYLFQSFALINSVSAIENILLGLHNVKLSKKDKKKQIIDLLEKLSLAHIAYDKVMTLSGGERQRVALARCLLKPGDLILADEPTGSLDDALANIAVSEMLSLQKDYGKTLIVVTHDMRVAEQCDNVFNLSAS